MNLLCLHNKEDFNVHTTRTLRDAGSGQLVVIMKCLYALKKQII